MNSSKTKKRQTVKEAFDNVKMDVGKHGTQQGLTPEQESKSKNRYMVLQKQR